MRESIRGKWALVTGASAGLGEDFSYLLAEMGCNLILAARRHDRLKKLAETLTESYGVETFVVPCDLSMPDAASGLYAQVQAKGLVVDILINNAGIGNFGNFVGRSWEDDQQLIGLNVMTLTHLTKLYLEEMVARNEGYVLLVSSLSSAAPCPTLASYAASKSYIRSLGEALNFELRKTKVKMCVTCPGYTQTEFFEANQMKRVTLLFRLTLMKSRAVARSSLNGMFRGRPFVVPGLLNKLVDILAGVLPRRIGRFVGYLFLLQEEPVQGGSDELAVENARG